MKFQEKYKTHLLGKNPDPSIFLVKKAESSIQPVGEIFAKRQGVDFRRELHFFFSRKTKASLLLHFSRKKKQTCSNFFCFLPRFFRAKQCKKRTFRRQKSQRKENENVQRSQFRKLHEQNLCHQVFCIYQILNFRLDHRQYQQIHHGRLYEHHAKYVQRRIIKQSTRDQK
jgi:hypothetical protein